MKTSFRNMASRIFALFAALALAVAQGGAQAQPAYAFSQQELDQMLAPIALYPDALLSQILMAATYPMEVIEAARWAGARPEISGDAAVRAAATENWDPSVKSLVAFPQVLARMAENLQWMQALGDAFLAQQSQVMGTVQTLRRKAQAAGNLRSDDRLSVVESGPNLLLQAFDPQLVYVPYYDPLLVYGSWWWPAYPPVYLRPWPGYYARPADARGFYWAAPVGISLGFFFGAIDWRRHEVRVVQVNNHYYDNLTTVRPADASPRLSVNRPGAWQHDPDRRGGLAYRSLDAQQRFSAASAPPDRGNQVRAAAARRSDRGMDARPDAQHGAQTRPNPQPAPAAPIVIRIEGRRPDARPEVHPRAPPAHGGRAIWTEMRREPGQRFEHAGEARIRPERQANPQAAQIEPNARIEVRRAPQQRMEVRPAQSAARQETRANVVARPKTVQ